MYFLINIQCFSIPQSRWSVSAVHTHVHCLAEATLVPVADLSCHLKDNSGVFQPRPYPAVFRAQQMTQHASFFTSVWLFNSSCCFRDGSGRSGTGGLRHVYSKVIIMYDYLAQRCFGINQKQKCVGHIWGAPSATGSREWCEKHAGPF